MTGTAADAAKTFPTEIKTAPGPGIYAAIAEVMSKTRPVGKDAKMQGKTAASQYNYREAEAVVAALRQHMIDAGLLSFPKIIEHTCEETLSGNGGRQYHHQMLVERTYVCVADGSSHSVVTKGESLDLSDKGANKAMTAAEKYAHMQVFELAAGDDPDAEVPTLAQPVTNDQLKAMLKEIRDLNLDEMNREILNSYIEENGWSVRNKIEVPVFAVEPIKAFAAALKKNEEPQEESEEEIPVPEETPPEPKRSKEHEQAYQDNLPDIADTY